VAFLQFLIALTQPCSCLSRHEAAYDVSRVGAVSRLGGGSFGCNRHARLRQVKFMKWGRNTINSEFASRYLELTESMASWYKAGIRSVRSRNSSGDASPNIISPWVFRRFGNMSPGSVREIQSNMSSRADDISYNAEVVHESSVRNILFIAQGTDSNCTTNTNKLFHKLAQGRGTSYKSTSTVEGMGKELVWGRVPIRWARESSQITLTAIASETENTQQTKGLICMQHLTVMTLRSVRCTV
jgi:hypothetical protein